MSTNTAFPKYLVIIEIGDGKKHQSYMCLRDAGAAYDSGWAKVSIGDFVLTEDFKLREMTDEDRSMISEAADKHSESK